MKQPSVPFMARVQLAVLALMLACIVAIAQQVNFSLYQIGLVGLIAATIVQFAAGNTPVNASWMRAIRSFVLVLAVLVCLIGVSILLAPWLSTLGKGGPA